ncbi:MAG: MFS transporter [Acidimicrobiia bacterium]|jgi:EmrB/QacA subfamily drug resistance transporter
MTPTAQQVHDRRWYVLGVLCLSLLIVFVGNSSLNVAIPTLSRDLHASESQLQWMIAAYSLVFAGLLFTAGALGDRFGRKGALQAGLVVYLAACVFATLSHSTWQLIAARAAMGLGAAFIMPSTLSILVNVFPPNERTKAIAIWAAVVGAAGAIGPVATGLILGHFWYGAVFLVNIPIITLAFVAGWFLLPKSRDPQQAQIDPLGAILSIVGIVALVYGLIEAPSHGWTSTTTLVAFGVAFVVLTLFAAWELHTDTPMLDIRFFRNPAFSTGTSGMILVFMSMYGLMFLMTQYFQLILGYSALSAAVRLLPMAAMLVIVSPLTPRLGARFGANKTVAGGMLCTTVGLFAFRQVGTDTPYLAILGALAFINAGFALSMSPMTAAIMSAVPPRRAGAGSAMNDAAREFGAALGIAVMGSIAASQFTHALGKLTGGLPLSSRERAGSSIAGAIRIADTLGGRAGATLRTGAERAFLDGFHLSVTIGSCLCLVAAVIVWRYLPRTFAHEGAMHGAVESLEEAAELGIAGVPPVFADQRFPGDPDVPAQVSPSVRG